LRQHKIDKIFKIDNSIGISNVIMGDTFLSAAIKTIPDLSNLNIITAGGQVPNPSELLGSNRMKELLGKVRESYDHIILDSAPVMAVSDPLLLFICG
jgi:Mrp family chromosome partitioning ATPase